MLRISPKLISSGRYRHSIKPFEKGEYFPDVRLLSLVICMRRCLTSNYGVHFSLSSGDLKKSTKKLRTSVQVMWCNVIATCNLLCKIISLPLVSISTSTINIIPLPSFSISTFSSSSKMFLFELPRPHLSYSCKIDVNCQRGITLKFNYMKQEKSVEIACHPWR